MGSHLYCLLMSTHCLTQVSFHPLFETMDISDIVIKVGLWLGTKIQQYRVPQKILVVRLMPDSEIRDDTSPDRSTARLNPGPFSWRQVDQRIWLPVLTFVMKFCHMSAAQIETIWNAGFMLAACQIKPESGNIGVSPTSQVCGPKVYSFPINTSDI
jgi:hypothetical protein